MLVEIKYMQLLLFFFFFILLLFNVSIFFSVQETCQVPPVPSGHNQHSKFVQQMSGVPRFVIKWRVDLFVVLSTIASFIKSDLHFAIINYIFVYNHRKGVIKIFSNGSQLTLFNFQADFIIAMHKILLDIDQDAQKSRTYDSHKKHIFYVLDRVMKQVNELFIPCFDL